MLILVSMHDVVVQPDAGGHLLAFSLPLFFSLFLSFSLSCVPDVSPGSNGGASAHRPIAPPGPPDRLASRDAGSLLSTGEELVVESFKDHPHPGSILYVHEK